MPATRIAMLLVFAYSLVSRFVSITAAPSTTTKISITPSPRESCQSIVDNPYLSSISHSGSSSLYNTYCSRYRKCFPSAINNNFFLHTDFKDNDYEAIETYIAHFFMPYFYQLASKTDDEDATKCLNYGLFFICNAYYPMCINIGDAGPISPCREVCETTVSHCSKALPVFRNSTIFNCSQYHPSTSANCLAGVSDGCDTANGTATDEPSDEPSTSDGTTTDEPTTSDGTTTDEPTTSDGTTTDEPTTSDGTTTDEPTTSDGTTTDEPSTSDEPTTDEPTTSDEPTTVEPTTDVPKDNRPSSPCRNTRESYSKNVILSKGNGGSMIYKFLAYVRVLEKFTATVNEKQMVAYNATLLQDFDLACSSDAVTCNKNVTVFTTDDDDCNSVTSDIDSVDWKKKNIIIAGGNFTDNGQWLLDGKYVRCVIAPDGDDISKDNRKRGKINSRWLKDYSCNAGSTQRSPCSVDA